MYPLKQSTAITVVFHAVLSASGADATGIADGSWTKRISKGSGAFAAMTVTITEMENGFYSFPLSTTHSDTLGILTMSFSAATVTRVNLQYRVHARIPDDFTFPTVSGRSLDVTSTGEAGIDWANIGAPTTTQALTNTTINTTAIANLVWDTDATGRQTAGTFGQAIGDPVADTNTIYKAVVTDATGATVGVDVVAVQADTDNIQTRLPAALVAGRMDSSVGAMATDTLTAAALAADAVTEIQSGLATSASIVAVQADTDNIQTRLPAALVTGRMDSSVGAMATDTLTAAALAADAVTEIQSGLATAASITTVQADTDNIQTRLPAALVAGRMDSSVGAMATDTLTSTALAASAVTEIQSGLATSASIVAVQADTDDIQTRLPAALVAGRMDSSVGAMTAAAVDAVWAKTMTELAAVPGVTASILLAVEWVFLASRNKILQTSTTQTIRNDADAAAVGASTVSDDGTTFIRGKFA